MFEVGKRYRAIKDVYKIKKDNIYLLLEMSWDDHTGIFEGKEDCWYRLQNFDPTPVDDTPAPRMVTTCDIGARVVRGRDWGYPIDASQGGENAIGTITENATGNNCWVLWDNGIKHVYRIGEYGKYFDLYYADEQPKKEVAPNQELPGVGICKDCGCEVYGIHFCVPKGIADAFKKASQAMVDLGKLAEAETKDDDGTDKTPPDPAPGIASIMFGSKPRLIYGSLMQIQGPTKDEQARNARTEEERKRYGK